MPGLRRRIDDMPFLSSLQHTWRKSVHTMDNTPEIYRKYPFPVLLLSIQHRRPNQYARIVVNDVNGAETIPCCICQCFY